MLTWMKYVIAVSRPPQAGQGERRRVLNSNGANGGGPSPSSTALNSSVSSSSSSRFHNHNSGYATSISNTNGGSSKVLRAKVDMSQLGSPSTSLAASPQLSSSPSAFAPRSANNISSSNAINAGATSSPSSWSTSSPSSIIVNGTRSSRPPLIQNHRESAPSIGARASAPSTPIVRSQTMNPSPSTYRTPTTTATTLSKPFGSATVSAALSPNLNHLQSTKSPFSSSVSRSATRSPSPTRPRSPRHRPANESTNSSSSTTTPTAASVAAELRGQNDSFPKTIDYLPSSVSTRSIHSPSLRHSPSFLGSSTLHHTNNGPGLSTSPGSTSTTASSPMSSPNLYSPVMDSQPRIKSAISLDVKRPSNNDLPTPITSPLLPAFSPNYATPPPARPRPGSPQRMTASANAKIVARSSPVPSSPNRTRPAPTTAASTSSSRPPSSLSRHRRSQSTASTTSSIFSNPPHAADSSSTINEIGSSHPNATSSSWGRKDSSTTSSSTGGGRTSGTSDQGLLGIDWSRPQHFDDLDDSSEGFRFDEDDPMDEAREDDTWSRKESRDGLRPLTTAGDGPELDQTIVLPPTTSARPGIGKRVSVDELREEKDARIQRKILDLEITNKSLLSINTSLEKLKLKHTQEIRDLRRRMRESNTGVALAPFRSPRKLTTTASDRNQQSSGEKYFDLELEDDEDDREDEEGGGESDEETPWETLLANDPHFGAVCTTLESLLRRGREAIASKVDLKGLGGRVLTAAEMEEEGTGEMDASMIDGEPRWIDVAVQTDVIGQGVDGGGGSGGAMSSRTGSSLSNNSNTKRKGTTGGWQR